MRMQRSWHIDLANGKLTVCCRMPFSKACLKTVTLPVTPEQYMIWAHGEHIQNVMPHLSAGEREIIISGTCDPCFKELFKEPEDDELTPEQIENLSDDSKVQLGLMTPEEQERREAARKGGEYKPLESDS